MIRRRQQQTSLPVVDNNVKVLHPCSCLGHGEALAFQMSAVSFVQEALALATLLDISLSMRNFYVIQLPRQVKVTTLY